MDMGRSWIIQKAIYDEENMKIYLESPYDTLKLYNSLAKMYDLYLKCDELAQIPNEKGKVKNKYRRMQMLRRLFG